MRPLDIAATNGFESATNPRVVEFGFGSIGQLRLLANLGAKAYGIEVDPLLKALYSEPQDIAPIADGRGVKPGSITLIFGKFPAEPAVCEQLGESFDLFISKNTLKRGYVHPERKTDPKRLLNLGVDDETFVKEVHQLLKPNGLFLIYNLHPAQAAQDEPYIPWADGRSPFSAELFEQLGFEIIGYNVDDSEKVRQMGKILGWQSEMDLENDLFATYTLVRKTNRR